MLIAVHGSYFTDNFGDVLLVRMAADWVRASVPGARIAMPAIPRHLAALYGADEVGIWSLLKSKALVLTGGGYLGERGSRKLRWSLRNVVRHMPVPSTARGLGIPIVCIGVGFGPLSHAVARWSFSALLRWCRVVAVRDIESFRFAVDYGVDANSLVVTADCALAIPQSPRAERSSTVPVLGIHVTRGLSQNHREAFVRAVEMLALRFPSLHVVLFSDQGGALHPSISDQGALAEYSSRLSVPHVVEAYQTPERLIQLLAGCDAVVTPKLHVGIVATALGRLVCSTPMHSKTVRFYRQIEASDRCIPSENLSADAIVSVVERGLDRRDDVVTVPALARSAAERNRVLLESFLGGLIKKDK